MPDDLFLQVLQTINAGTCSIKDLIEAAGVNTIDAPAFLLDATGEHRGPIHHLQIDIESGLLQLLGDEPKDLDIERRGFDRLRLDLVLEAKRAEFA